jgi:hypothetical protein
MLLKVASLFRTCPAFTFAVRDFKEKEGLQKISTASRFLIQLFFLPPLMTVRASGFLFRPEGVAL